MRESRLKTSSSMQEEMMMVRNKEKRADSGIVEENKLEQQRFPYLSRFPRVDHYPRPKFI